MSSTPLISIIIPAFQVEDTIQACLDALFTQSFQDFEVIVVNDGSTDRTREILKQYENTSSLSGWEGDRGRVMVIDQKNLGSNPARNRGAVVARGMYLLFLDADIVMRRNCLEQMLGTLQKYPDAAYAYASFQYGKKLFRLWPFDAARLRTMPYIPTSSLLRAKDFPRFDEDIKRLQDWDLWLTMLKQGKRGAWIPKVLFSVTPRKNGISRWVPRWLFWIPWHWVHWMPERVHSYQEALTVIRKKHGIEKK